MKICVLNGSPKGEAGITVQYARYMQKKLPDNEYVYFNIAHDIKKIEKDESFFQGIMEAVETSDGVVWAFPLYVMMVHAHYKRFIELVFERGRADSFRGKYAALVASSIHFYDNTAINYMHAVCDDLKMSFCGYFSADMHDFLEEKKRTDFLIFAQNFLDCMAAKTDLPKTYEPVSTEKINYTPALPDSSLDVKGQRTVILTDSAEMDENIGKMVERFRLLTNADVMDISKISILSGCLGCIACGFDNECVFHGKDDIEKTYGAIENYDIIVYAGTIRDRYLSARWKMFIDRRFFKTHQPHYTGKQIAFLVSGPLRQNQNLLEILDALVQLEFSNFCGVLTDEYSSSEEIDRTMDGLAKRMIDYSMRKYIQPKTFLGVGGFKLFRDDMWGRLRFPFRMDHRYYKKHGLYDFPQKDIKSRFQNAFLLFLIKFPKIKKQIREKMKDYMIMPYAKILDNE
jgi:multimeric flavodoxin WrbA